MRNTLTLSVEYPETEWSDDLNVEARVILKWHLVMLG
jgi:hypothetical protein